MVGRLKPKTEIYSSKGGEQTRWNLDKCIQQYDGLLSKNMAEANAWRFVGLLALLLFAASIGILIYTIHLPKTELVVVSVNDVGQARYVGTTRGVKFDEYGMKEACVENIIRTFIERTYTITTDSDLMYHNFKSCLYYLGNQKRKNYMLMINTEDPFKDVGRIKRNVEIETVIPISPNSYQCDFFVTSSELTGYSAVTKKMRAIFSLAQLDSEGYKKLTEEERIANPIGIYITEYNIVEVK